MRIDYENKYCTKCSKTTSHQVVTNSSGFYYRCSSCGVKKYPSQRIDLKDKKILA